MQRHFLLMATYNRWANQRLYAAAAALDDSLFRKDVGVYFKSVHGTLNHLLVADRIWLHRLQRTGEQPTALNAILFEDLTALRGARSAEDDRLLGFVAALDAATLDLTWEYRTLNGTPPAPAGPGDTRAPVQPPDPPSRPGARGPHAAGSGGTAAAGSSDHAARSRGRRLKVTDTSP